MDESSCQISAIVFTLANSWESCECISCFDLTQCALKDIDLFE